MQPNSTNTLQALIDSAEESLRERMRVRGSLRRLTIELQGEFVLYWMHSAMRVDENPALDASIYFANRLGKPLIVYQGLSERYPFASDRHHTFILEGARDVQKSLRERCIPYVLNVETSEGPCLPEQRCRPIPHLRNLAQQAAVVITEDMPVAPLVQWSSMLQRSISAPVVLVDTACVLPMQLVGRAYDRAFAFRSATEKGRRRRLQRPPMQSELRVQSGHPSSLGVDSIDLQTTSIPELVARCRIDHTIAPTPANRGGSEAGYARWQAFKERGLAAYAKTRNDATRDGTSRMSAYLHFGMVSPMRIAREASEQGSEGAEKFLDELLIWRELAYAFCFYRPEHGRISALPTWSVSTLRDHQHDRRESHASWETLARGCTGDALWDAAQHSLLIHGELHNNVRMTWGKALLGWTSNAQEALDRLIDLNHRYALDGRDPASYGGLLWCLGQFDRPFQPEQAVIGTVRPRPTSEHLQRLDLVRYRKRVTACPFTSQSRIAVIGAGLSGLICARTLADHRLDVTLFDKSSRVGGRLSSRPSQAASDALFDHGAQYFTARDPRFQRLVDSWHADGIVKPWDGVIVKLGNGTCEPVGSKPCRYVGTPDMNAVARHLASQLTLRANTRVQRVVRNESQSTWQIEGEQGEPLGSFNYVVIAIPAPQAAELLDEQSSFTASLRAVRWRPCWAVMLTLTMPSTLEFDAAFVHDSTLAWIAKNSSKPTRSIRHETWLLHSTGEWAVANQPYSGQTNDERRALHARVQAELTQEFCRVTGHAECVDLAAVDSHFWRYALPENPLSSMYLFDQTSQLACCGDWCGGPRVEGAFLSGAALAGRLLGHVSQLESTSSPKSGSGQQQLLF